GKAPAAGGCVVRLCSGEREREECANSHPFERWIQGILQVIEALASNARAGGRARKITAFSSAQDMIVPICADACRTAPRSALDAPLSASQGGHGAEGEGTQGERHFALRLRADGAVASAAADLHGAAATARASRAVAGRVARTRRPGACRLRG